jgi:ceramide kinase
LSNVEGRARFIYEKKVLPIFDAANVRVDTIYTDRANQAQEHVMNETLTDYDGLVCVGGDGMFAELCHGLLLRSARQAHLNIDHPQVNIVRPDLRIGVIPAGSTDALVFGTTGVNDPVTSALQIIVGESLSIDITTVINEHRCHPLPSILSFRCTMNTVSFVSWRRC